MTVKFSAQCIKEYLSGDKLDAVFLRFIGIFPHINKNNVKLPRVLFFQFIKNGRHHLAGNALSSAEIKKSWQRSAAAFQSKIFFVGSYRFLVCVVLSLFEGDYTAYNYN